MSQFTILLGGDLVATARLRAQIAGMRVMAADSGMRHAAKLSVTPELWVGDFDSADAALQTANAAVPRAEFPAEKDRTDGEIAIAAARECGATRLVVAGAFGGDRPDHAFLHLTAAMRAAEDGLDILLTSGTTEGRPLLPGSAEFDYPGGTLFSVIAFNDLTALTLTGVKWPLKDRYVPFGSSLTISNEVTDTLRASLKDGRAMVIAHMPATGEG